MYEIKCSDCGQAAIAPFKPTVGKPVYCKSCYAKHMLKRQEGVGTNFGFAPKQAWARRRDNWHGRKEEKPVGVFQHP